MNLNSILIGSEDPQRLAEYYTKLFGEPTWNDGGYTGWMTNLRASSARATGMSSRPRRSAPAATDTCTSWTPSPDDPEVHRAVAAALAGAPHVQGARCEPGGRTELRVVLKVTSPEGKTGTQPSRVFGIPGPRWMLRATFFGRPALEPSETGAIERALKDVVVRRGGDPHAPGEALPLTVPSELLQQ